MKARIKNLYNRIFFTPHPLPPGSYNSTMMIDGKPNRLHLRIENEGQGILVVNAATVLHLNQTAAEIAYYLAKNMAPQEIITELVKRYQVSSEIASQDMEELKVRISTLMETPDLDPETFLDMERAVRHSSEFSAPLRMDCALTYQIPSGSPELYTPAHRVDRSLDTEEWKIILDKAWEWGVPHVVFTGGEPTLRPDLFELIQHAEDIGQVSGLITDGFRLTEKEYLHELLFTGLDHIMLILVENEDISWEAIRDTVQEDIHVSVHLTLTDSNKSRIQVLLDKLFDIGVRNISFSSPSKINELYLTEASRMAAEKGLSLVYDLPVPYSALNPVNLELEEDHTMIEGAGRSWVYVEPDGDVLPGQGNPYVLGNLLKDSWINVSSNRKIYLSK